MPNQSTIRERNKEICQLQGSIRIPSYSIPRLILLRPLHSFHTLSTAISMRGCYRTKTSLVERHSSIYLLIHCYHLLTSVIALLSSMGTDNIIFHSNKGNILVL